MFIKVFFWEKENKKVVSFPPYVTHTHTRHMRTNNQLVRRRHQSKNFFFEEKNKQNNKIAMNNVVHTQELIAIQL